MEFLVDILLCFIMSFGYLFISARLFRTRLDFRKIKTYFGILLFVILMLIIQKISLPINSLFIFLILIFINFWLFSKSVLDSFIVSSFLYLFIIFSDIIFSSLFYFLKIETNVIVKLIINIGIIIFSYLLSNLALTKKIITYLVTKRPKNILFLMSIIFLFFYFTSILNYFHVPQSLYIPLFSIFLIFFYLLFVKLLFEKSTIDQLNSNYNQLLQMVELCETMIDEQRTINHENMNQLLTLQTLVHDKKVEKYITHLLEEDYSKVDQKFLMEIHDLPFSIFKGFLYYKYYTAKKKDILLKVEVGKKAKALKENDLTTAEMTNLLKIMGVFVDNAIEESETFLFKEIKITIFRNNQNELLISVANQMGNPVQHVEDMIGNSTKGQGHGYGLLLVQSIIKNNPKFQHKTEIIDDILVQNLTISL